MSFHAWNPEISNMPATRIPVTVLSGFLGSGKTTVLNRILEASSSRKFAVLVNDIGDVNIDASLIQSAVKEMDGAIAGMLELQGGCICCSIQTEMLDAVLELSQQFKPDHILIEATGVAEPKAILETFYSKNQYGRSGTDFVEVANMVTVLDGANLQQHLESPENTGKAKRIHLHLSDPRRPLQELLIEQIECADILLINKIDVLQESARQRFCAYLKNLNPSAHIWTSQFGDIDVESLMQEHRFSEKSTLTGAGWQQAIFQNEPQPSPLPAHAHSQQHHPHSNQSSCQHDHDHKHDHKHGDHEGHHHKDYGLETFVFNARQPFVESRFLKVLRTGLPGVLRAKGFYWTDRVPTRTGLLSIAGKMLRSDYLSEWWYTRIERGEASLDEAPELVQQCWLADFGDRRQELVFIGIDLDRETIEKALQDCLVITESDWERLRKQPWDQRLSHPQ